MIGFTLFKWLATLAFLSKTIKPFATHAWVRGSIPGSILNMHFDCDIWHFGLWEWPR